MTAILCSSMPCEVEAVDLYKCLIEDSTVIQMRVYESRSFPITSAKICSLSTTPIQISLLGTYCDDYLKRLRKQYCFVKVPDGIHCCPEVGEDGCFLLMKSLPSLKVKMV